MKWISPKDQLPPQGKKILHFMDRDDTYKPFWWVIEETKRLAEQVAKAK